MSKKRNGAKRLLGVGVAMLIGLGSHLVAAQTILTVTEETILTPSDSTADDDFGGAVAMDGNTAIVGAPIQLVGGETNQGSAYIYVRDNGGTWTQQAKLNGSGGDALDHFGTSVDIEGDTAVVGSGIGNKAHVFVRTGTQWNEQAQLTAPGVGSVDNFGESVAISGNTIVVGALRDDAATGGSIGPGTAFVFVRNGTSWNLQATLFADDGEDNDEFGRSVDLDGDRAIIGASADDQVGAQNSGSAYVFLRTGTTWNQEAKLEVADITAFDQMGYAVALSGDTALIGARSGNGAITSSGVAYVFRRNGTTWAQEDKLFPQNENPLDVGGSRFGLSVALFGDRALIGAPRTNLPVVSVDGGAAYVFERVGTTWSQKKKLTASNAASFGEFGGGVALTQDRGLVGASEQFSTFPGLNAAYPFSLITLPLSGPIIAAVLPSSRSVQVGTTATAFGVIINSGTTPAIACGLSPLTTIPATFSYQMTDPITNAPTGSPDTPVDIPAGGSQTFIFSLTPTDEIPPTEVQLSFACANTAQAASTVGLNTLLLSASVTLVPDIVALVATPTNDGIVHLPGATGGIGSTGVFVVASLNVGATGTITISADTGNAILPLSITLCQTNTGTGACLAPPSSTVTTDIVANTTPSFGVFVEGLGPVTFDPGVNRIFIRFKEGGITRGSTSVAVQTP